MAHPQDTPRGLLTKALIGIPVGGGILCEDYSTTTNLITAGSTGLKCAAAVFVSGQAVFGKLSANSTALILPNGVRVGALAAYLTANSTGIKLGSRYLSTNTTGNSTT